jgi:DNA replication protein DnaC
MITNINAQIIDDMVKWLNRDPSFNGNLQAGFLFHGPVGTGKTLLIQALSEAMVQMGCRTRLVPFGSNTIVSNFRENNQEEINKYNHYRMISIDDLAMEREPKTMSWGNTLYPVYGVLMTRFENGLMTHGTTNLNVLDLLKFYNDDMRRLEDRMALMFNIREVSGNSWRQSINS